ncbi:MAG: GmrSD restriction endonuclease domain-containing protein [Mongoliitalea sp.]
MNKGNQISFWNLISEYSIEIPTIQRDYTYGRNSAIEIGLKLTKSILATCKLPFKNLHLDFIYGKLEGIENFHRLEKNKHSIESLLHSIKSYADNLHLNVRYETTEKTDLKSEIVTFIPLDGQQRLTTLFLIHWYFAFLRKDTESLHVLKRFTYTTRNSSKEFLQLICSMNSDEVTLENGLVEGITNHELFFNSWKKDPTVNSMLIMLGHIEKFVLDQPFSLTTAWKRLTESDSVTFDFFDLDDFELADELYVKMNARGKSLTGFENFKAWLLKNFKEEIGDGAIGKKLDIDWYDLFWKDQEDVEKIDDHYLQFFKNLYLSDYLLENYGEDSSASEINTDKNVEILRSKTEKNLIPLFENNGTFSKNIQRYINLLDIFSKMEGDYLFNPNFQKSSLLEFFFKNNQGLNYPENTYHYALSRYLIETNGNLAYFGQWARVMGNLIFNTPIETAYLHRIACMSIDTLIRTIGSENVYQKIAQLDGGIEFFDGEQVHEEILKAKLIIEHPEINFERQFIEFESHRYFYGQIGFILKIANYNFDDLVIKGGKIQALFSEEVLNQTNHLLFRAFLSQMDTFFNSENHYKYYFPKNIRGTLRERNENWRRFIKGNLALVEQVIAHQHLDENNIIPSLESICQNWKTSDNYIRAILTNPTVLNYANQHHIRKYHH